MQEVLAPAGEDQPQQPRRPRGERPYHPLLVAAYPILFLYQANADEVTIGQASAPLAASIIGATVLYLVMTKVLKGAGRAALVTTTFLFFFFSYGHIKRALDEKILGPFRFAGEKFLVPVLGGVFLYLIWRILRTTKTREKNQLLNLLSLVMVGLVTFQIVAGGGATSRATVTAGPPLLQPLGSEQLSKARDIYYLVFDRYTSNRILKERYRFDNSPFLNYLRSNGFAVTEDARSIPRRSGRGSRRSRPRAPPA